MQDRCGWVGLALVDGYQGWMINAWGFDILVCLFLLFMLKLFNNIVFKGLKCNAYKDIFHDIENA